MALPKELISKYTHYRSLEHGIYSVTLSTYVKCAASRRNDAARQSDRWRVFWDHHFIFGVKRCLPFKAKIDHDWAIEESPDGHYHYHGILAIDNMHKDRFWRNDELNRKLRKRLDSFRVAGSYRPFRINKHLIEPTQCIESWLTYSTKQNPIYLNTNVAPFNY